MQINLTWLLSTGNGLQITISQDLCTFKGIEKWSLWRLQLHHQLLLQHRLVVVNTAVMS